MEKTLWSFPCQVLGPIATEQPCAQDGLVITETFSSLLYSVILWWSPCLPKPGDCTWMAFGEWSLENSSTWAWELFGTLPTGLGQKHSLDYFTNMQDHILLAGVLKWDECSHKCYMEKIPLPRHGINVTATTNEQLGLCFWWLMTVDIVECFKI